jgi:3-hydroxyacyl-[acyl-carrier-protein] dehydratase
MRWFWIDRFTEFEQGKRATAIRTVSQGDEHLDDYLPGFPLMPNSLVIEGIAQTGGLLAGETSGFKERVVLAKVAKAQFHCYAVPGDTLTYTAVLADVKSDGAICQGTSYIGTKLQAEVEMVFAYLDARFEGVQLFEPGDFLAMLRLFAIYDVGRKADGSPLDIPPHLLEAERTANAGF